MARAEATRRRRCGAATSPAEPGVLAVLLVLFCRPPRLLRDAWASQLRLRHLARRLRTHPSAPVLPHHSVELHGDLEGTATPAVPSSRDTVARTRRRPATARLPPMTARRRSKTARWCTWWHPDRLPVVRPTTGFRADAPGRRRLGRLNLPPRQERAATKVEQGATAAVNGRSRARTTARSCSVQIVSEGPPSARPGLNNELRGIAARGRAVELHPPHRWCFGGSLSPPSPAVIRTAHGLRWLIAHHAEFQDLRHRTY